MPGKRIEVPANGQVDLLTQITRDQLAKADDVAFHVKEENIIINDGDGDLTWLQAIDYIRNYRFKVDVQNASTETGVLLAAITKPDFKEVKIYSPNLCDKTTWYNDSVRVEKELLTQIDASGSKWSGNYNYWIDLTHGKIPQEHNMASAYPVVIEVFNSAGEKLDGYTEVDAHTGRGDYDVDYRNGSVEFHFDILDGYIEASYNYATGFSVYISPISGKELHINKAEIQFTTDVVITDTSVFQLYVYSAVVEQALSLPPGTLGPPGSKYPYTSATKYNSAGDYIAEANGNYPICPAFGGSDWRGLRHPIITIPFDYTALKPLKSSLGAEVRVMLENNEEFGGTYGTVTFYCHSKDEE